jgi:hypothetical protein
MGGALVLFLCFGVVAGRVALRGVCVVFFVLAFGLVLYPSSVFAPCVLLVPLEALIIFVDSKKKKSNE